MTGVNKAMSDRLNGIYADASSYVKNNYVLVAGLLIASIAPLLGLYYAKSFGFNVIYWDEWEHVLLIDKFFSGHLTLADLFVPRNEHVVIFPKILYLLEASLFHYQTKVLCYLSWLLVTVSVIVTGKVFLDQHRGNKYAILFFLPVPFLFFTFNQWESLLFGSTSCEYLGNFGVVFALFALYLSRGTDRYFALAAASGVLGSFSFVTGLLAWPVGLAYLLMSRRKKGIIPGLYWSAAGALSAFWYYYNIVQAPKGEVSHFFPGLAGTVGYALALMGSYFASDLAGAIAFGVIIALLSALVLYMVARNGLVKEHAFWLALVLYSAASVASILYGRSSLGMEQALSSRYLPFTIIGIVGIYLIAAGLFLKSPRDASAGKAAYALLLLVVVYGLAMGYSNGYHTGEIIKGGNVLYGSILYGHDHMSDDQLKLLYPNVTVLKERIPIAEKYKLSVFYDGRG